jgi:CheY-like chemotaxis protein
MGARFSASLTQGSGRTSLLWLRQSADVRRREAQPIVSGTVSLGRHGARDQPAIHRCAFLAVRLSSGQARHLCQLGPPYLTAGLFRVVVGGTQGFLWFQECTHQSRGLRRSACRPGGRGPGEPLQPDIVVLDITMPGLNGLEATHEVLRSAQKQRSLSLPCTNPKTSCARSSPPVHAVT